MNNEYTELIKTKMKNFKQYYLCKEEVIDFSISDSEINPHLLGYIFDKILHFNVKYQIFEKMNYIITFKYKGKVGRIIHSKLSFKLYLEQEIEEEVKTIFIDVINILEKALLKYSEDAIINNSYSLPNYNYYYIEKINIIDKHINDTINKIDKMKKVLKEKEQALIKSESAYEKIIVKKYGNCSVIETPLQRLHSNYLSKIKELKIKLSYLIEIYTDNYFSYIEHLSCLLYPMTYNYKEDEKFSEYLKTDWLKKINKINNKNFNEIVSKLSEIKELYRNRFAHGLFSREKLVNVIIPDFGSYPLWIGRKYCKGYKGTSNKLTQFEYNKIKDVFTEFMTILKKEYNLQWNIIDSGIPTFLKIKYYEDSLINEKNNRLWIEKYWYIQDNLLNMDW